MNARHQYIIQLVNARGSIAVSELAQLTGVSEVTIRQDLNLLERDQFLRRIHGSALALDSDDVGTRMHTRYSIKQAIARHAAQLINKDESVFIEGGSTNALLARALSERHDVTVITVSHYIAHLLKDAACEVIVLGGMLQKSSESMIGPLTRYCIHQVHFHKAFVGIDGWHRETGFTGRNMLRCDVVDAVLAKGVDTFVLTDSSKFGQIYPYPLSPGYQVRRLITDNALDSASLLQLQDNGVEVIQVQEDNPALFV
ncbi:MAG: DNA-binding transcriptional regulator YciT [Enterobacterales bacterium endosymbiont of Blomia tropicalis]|uniref:DeoR/GlpR family DNA-binding transcription regulator n=1 Tax=Mixta mediterraneensis TaxID=2758443 RepID=UPI0025A8FC92|nr:DNA-binding transcriptional regulator YciT [Mixta mediterraneensis]MDL4915990.1 DNA-binding transcriptional regulator YciT [Mixta mediterraneensis]